MNTVIHSPGLPLSFLSVFCLLPISKLVHERKKEHSSSKSSNHYNKLNHSERKSKGDTKTTSLIFHCSLFLKTSFYKKLFKNFFFGRGGATHLSSQHTGGRGWHISEFKANLIYWASSMAARATKRKPCLKRPNQTHSLYLYCVTCACLWVWVPRQRIAFEGFLPSSSLPAPFLPLP